MNGEFVERQNIFQKDRTVKNYFFNNLSYCPIPAHVVCDFYPEGALKHATCFVQDIDVALKRTLFGTNFNENSAGFALSAVISRVCAKTTRIYCIEREG